jgi:flagellar biosynthesis/type III secretory pathway protein FliH
VFGEADHRKIPFDELINSKLMPIDFDVTKDTLFLQGLEKGIEKGIEKGLEKGIEKGIERGMEKGLEKGEEQGIEKGRLLERRRQERRRRQKIRRMHDHQIPLDIICEVMSVTPEYVQKVLERKGR